MKVITLIEKLKQFKSEDEVCIFDLEKNEQEMDGGDGKSSGGIYNNFGVYKVDGSTPFIALGVPLTNNL
jgi:hypothetical protein